MKKGLIIVLLLCLLSVKLCFAETIVNKEYDEADFYCAFETKEERPELKTNYRVEVFNSKTQEMCLCLFQKRNDAIEFCREYARIANQLRYYESSFEVERVADEINEFLIKYLSDFTYLPEQSDFVDKVFFGVYILETDLE